MHLEKKPPPVSIPLNYPSEKVVTQSLVPHQATRPLHCEEMGFAGAGNNKYMVVTNEEGPLTQFYHTMEPRLS
ncbi:hypothetical protein AAFF_G00017320 [Aldrovandia affinis]|uniref:Uncharacterized protein n=1 Tax=Aldrovandia affinis TaxID=143900 RepID=A0AAD7S7U9_9TELE|nr:hypothetical protein AAFF_G00017320 [Aldrovandia affinis]